MPKFNFDHKEAEQRAQVPIDHLIDKCGARCLWQEDSRTGKRRTEMWFTRVERMMYLVIFNTDGGWEIFSPVSPSNDIAKTLAKVV